MFGNRRIRKFVEESFATDPREGFRHHNAENRFDLIRRYDRAVGQKEDGKWRIDDITWDDLEMNQVFLRVNHTNSFIGEQMLYRKLHLYDQDSEKQKKTVDEKILEYLQSNPDIRTEIEMRMYNIGKQEEGYYLPEFLLNTSLWKVGSTLVFHLLQLLLVLGILSCIFFDSIWSEAFLGGVVLVNFIIYLISKQKYEVYFNSLADLKRVYDFARWMEKEDRKHHLFVSDEVRKAVRRLSAMSKIIVGMNNRRQSSMTGDVASILSEYLFGVLLLDVSMFNHIMRIIENKQEEVLTLMRFTGELDVHIAILSYRESLAKWCIPELSEGGIEAEGIAHPLLKNPVSNDFRLEDRAIITGANASGKSTFMKSLAINCILAQTIHTCIAKSISLQPVLVVTCMSLRDDILTGESYYFREAKYMKRILDLTHQEDSVFIVIDEILKGTNTKERVAASKAILEYIGNTGCLSLVATHDNELTENPAYKNYYFTSQIKEKDIVFDYLIHEGCTDQTNAIALLSYLGYPKEIIDKAKVNMHENR